MDRPYDEHHASQLFSSREYEELVTYCMTYVAKRAPAAECMMGSLYQLGLGVEQDMGRSEQLLLRAAEADFGLAWCNLGTLYRSGWLGFEDQDKAAHCYRRAYELGSPTCIEADPPGNSQL